MIIKMRPLLVGMATFLPGIGKLTARHTGGTVSARYCYAVWLRHLTLLDAHGLSNTYETLAEFGPGDSLGIGLAALLSGTARYYALDVVRYANNLHNLQIFEELIDLFRDRAPIPDEEEFPLIRPLLKSYAFPDHILTDDRLRDALAPERLAAISQDLRLPNHGQNTGAMISYIVPWDDTGIITEGTVDLIISQAVLEYPQDLQGLYSAMYRWLKPGGSMSHLIDFGSHGMTNDWNGHWACPRMLWRLGEGRRRIPLNRVPHSVHTDLLRAAGFQIVADIRETIPSGIRRDQLTRQFRSITDDDLVTSVALMQSVKVE